MKKLLLVLFISMFFSCNQEKTEPKTEYNTQILKDFVAYTLTLNYQILFESKIDLTRKSLFNLFIIGFKENLDLTKDVLQEVDEEKYSNKEEIDSVRNYCEEKIANFKIFLNECGKNHKGFGMRQIGSIKKRIEKEVNELTGIKFPFKKLIESKSKNQIKV